MTEVRFDASDFELLGRAFLNLPGEIKAKAMARAMRRMRDMARTRIVKKNSARTDVTQAMIRERTTAYFNAGGNTIEVIEKSGWISLQKLGATQTATGVRVRLRGSYKHAFIGQMASGHQGVMIRELKARGGEERVARLKIRELFGPNPAHDITNNPEDYLDVMGDLIEHELLPRVIHEIDRILPR